MANARVGTLENYRATQPPSSLSHHQFTRYESGLAALLSTLVYLPAAAAGLAL